VTTSYYVQILKYLIYLVEGGSKEKRTGGTSPLAYEASGSTEVDSKIRSFKRLIRRAIISTAVHAPWLKITGETPLVTIEAARCGSLNR
jgi:hypothetical protein